MRNIFAWSHTEHRREFAHGTAPPRAALKGNLPSPCAMNCFILTKKKTMKKQENCFLIGQ